LQRHLHNAKINSTLSFPFFIAGRYFFAKKSHHAINVISIIAVLGVAVSTMAMVCTLSVFNGFKGLVESLFTAFDAELKVVPIEGKVINLDDPKIKQVRQLPCVQSATACLEDHALARYNGRQAMITLMGVEDNFPQTTDIYKILWGHGMFKLHADVLQYGVPGFRLAATLGMDASFSDPLEIYTPTKGERVNMMAPEENFNYNELNSPGVLFTVGQKKYDQDYVLCSLQFAQEMFEKEGQASSLEIRSKDNYSTDEARREIEAVLGPSFKVLDRYAQQEDVFRVMEIEKYIGFLFLTFILLVSCFNIVGSLSMLIIDKKDNLITMRNLGATDSQIRKIFLLEGWIISFFGAVIGVLVGLGLCVAQQEFHLLKLGDKAGAFIVEAYPVIVEPLDIVAVFVTVVLISCLVAWYPVRYVTKRLLN